MVRARIIDAAGGQPQERLDKLDLLIINHPIGRAANAKPADRMLLFADPKDEIDSGGAGGVFVVDLVDFEFRQTAHLRIYLNGKPRLDELVCDGALVATPAGSTAYNFSAGGPILFPQVAALCITPICPHMLTNRPVLVPDNSVIKIISRAETETAYLTIDGQIGAPLERDDTIVCRRSDKSVQLVRPPRAMFFDVLREKLSWGER